MEPRRFQSSEPREGDPIPFVIGCYRHVEETIPEHEGGDGTRTRRVRHDVEETFHAQPDVSGGVLVQIDLMRVGGKAGVNARGGDALFDFFDAALVPDDRGRFRKLIEDPSVFVHRQVLSDLAVWLYETYADRPTRASKP